MYVHSGTAASNCVGCTFFAPCSIYVGNDVGMQVRRWAVHREPARGSSLVKTRLRHWPWRGRTKSSAACRAVRQTNGHPLRDVNVRARLLGHITLVRSTSFVAASSCAKRLVSGWLALPNPGLDILLSEAEQSEHTTHADVYRVYINISTRNVHVRIYV